MEAPETHPDSSRCRVWGASRRSRARQLRVTRLRCTACVNDSRRRTLVPTPRAVAGGALPGPNHASDVSRRTLGHRSVGSEPICGSRVRFTPCDAIASRFTREHQDAASPARLRARLHTPETPDLVPTPQRLSRRGRFVCEGSTPRLRLAHPFASTLVTPPRPNRRCEPIRG